MCGICGGEGHVTLGSSILPTRGPQTRTRPRPKPLHDGCTVRVGGRGPRAARRPRKAGTNSSCCSKTQQRGPNWLVLVRRRSHAPQGDTEGPGGRTRGPRQLARLGRWQSHVQKTGAGVGGDLGVNLTLGTKISSKWTGGLNVNRELRKQQKDLGGMWTRPKFPRHSPKSTAPIKANRSTESHRKFLRFGVQKTL